MIYIVYGTRGPSLFHDVQYDIRYEPFIIPDILHSSSAYDLDPTCLTLEHLNYSSSGSHFLFQIQSRGPAVHDAGSSTKHISVSFLILKWFDSRWHFQINIHFGFHGRDRVLESTKHVTNARPVWIPNLGTPRVKRPKRKHLLKVTCTDLYRISIGIYFSA